MRLIIGWLHIEMYEMGHVAVSVCMYICLQPEVQVSVTS